MSADNDFASDFGHVRDPSQNDIQNLSLFPTFESELSRLGDQSTTMIISPTAITMTTSHVAPNQTSLQMVVYVPPPKRPDPPTFEKQGDAIRHEKSKYTPKNT